MDFAGECEHYAMVPIHRATAIMLINKIPQTPVGADLSAFAGCSALPLHLLKPIIGLFAD